jgi:DNA-binding MarR family transcriptional regulator
MKAHRSYPIPPKAVAALSQALEIKKESIRQPKREPDIFNADPWKFVMRWAPTGVAGPVAVAAEAARQRAIQLGSGAIPLVAVPFMGPAGRDRCEAIGVAWLDLSGNARITAPGIRVLTLGHPNQFKRAGRPSSPFTWKGARIARWLLMQPDRAWSQRELAQIARIDEGYASRVVAKLMEDELIVRAADGALRARDPTLLLDAWREAYRFDKHHIVRGHVAARSGDTLLRDLAENLRKAGVKHAATGLGAAWLYTGFAGFNLASFYLGEKPASPLLESLSFREEERGANVWLIVPADEGVFQGAADVNKIPCVHPVQIVLDLDAHPERSKEAAAELRKRLLKGKSNA